MGTLPYRDLIVWQRSRVLAGQVFDHWQDIENEIGQISALLKALGDRLHTKRSLESRTS